ncbi:uncharacterized protein METZ01_LOCUS77479 [marine metagenome]|uniref:Uncharacterized protein n=1 Tax=marine metagenome TaxID=408172 RepID=A0A381U8Q9_9ZZZZ
MLNNFALETIIGMPAYSVSYFL